MVIPKKQRLITFEAQSMKMLSSTEAELKESVVYQKTCSFNTKSLLVWCD